MLRRFLLPQVVLLIAAIVAVAVVAIAGADDPTGRAGAIVWTAILAAALAILASALFARRFVRAHVLDTAELFTAAVPAAAPKRRPRDPDVLEEIARTLGELMAEATKNQAHLMTIISSMSDGLVATDHQQRILLTNDAARELLAFRMPAVRGKQLWEVVPLEQVLKAVTEVSLTGQRKTVPVGPVNGRHLDVTITRLPLRPAGFIIVARDVTETMRYEELRKEFVANVSHELRTPLTVIKGFVETLQDGAIDDRPRAMQYLGTVEKHTEHLTNLVNDLLSLSRLDSTAAVPSPRPVHLARVAHKVAELMTPAAANKGHRLVVQVADGLHPIVGNPEYLERAVVNLVENAIKYTREDGLIRLNVRAEGGAGDGAQSLVVEVSDNGMGIAAHDLPRIFERFYRADRSRSRDAGGTGLGLSIVKHVVQVHHGSIEVQSAPGEGSTFRLKFPISPPEPPERAPDRASERDTRSTDPASGADDRAPDAGAAPA